MIATVRGNPFETLGIMPGALDGLTDEEVMQLAGDVFQSLSTIHDPNLGRLKRRYQAILEAWAALQDHETFIKMKGEHLKSEDDKVASLEKELRRVRVLLNDQEAGK